MDVQTGDLCGVYPASHPMVAGIGSSLPATLLISRRGWMDRWTDIHIVKVRKFHAVDEDKYCENSLANMTKWDRYKPGGHSRRKLQNEEA